MFGHRLPMPGPVFGAYPERALPPAAPWQRWLRGASRGPAGRSGSRADFVRRVRLAEAAAPVPGSQAFGDALHRLRAALPARGFDEALLAEAFALAGGALDAARGERPFDTQIVAARILLDERLAEMATGEGKTLAVMLAAATAALAGVPVHVITANPYLAGRDAEALRAAYGLLGLSVAAIDPAAPTAGRQATWAADVVHTTARDLIFDYLRDRLRAAGEPALLRGLCLALVDEADSVLIDEASTPFLLARPRPDAAAARRLQAAFAFAGTLAEGEHFSLQSAPPRAELTPVGRAACDGAPAIAGDMLWQHGGHRAELVETALTAMHALRRDVNYLMLDGKVEIVDPVTARVSPGRRWSRGLHGLVEIKEGLEPSPEQDTIASLSFQRFFPRYWRLAGTSGTLTEARAELRASYGLVVEPVPLRRPCRRVTTAPRVFADKATLERTLLESLREAHARGAPVLLGCDSVAEAERWSLRLQATGLPHQRLDARQDGDEAARVARAGESGAITVATSIAGRGTDIVLGPGVAERGGLHVLTCQQNDSPRTDRQLGGRAGRAGDPGVVHTFLSLDAPLFTRALPPPLRRQLARLARLARARGSLPTLLARALHRLAQRRAEATAVRRRTELREHDKSMRERLGFGAFHE